MEHTPPRSLPPPARVDPQPPSLPVSLQATGHVQLTEEGGEPDDDADDVEAAAERRPSFQLERADTISPFLVAFKVRPTFKDAFLDPDLIELAFEKFVIHELKGGVKKTFSQIDTNGNGTIDGGEMRVLLQTLGHSHITDGMIDVLIRAAHGARPHRAPSPRCTAEPMHHVWHRR